MEIRFPGRESEYYILHSVQLNNGFLLAPVRRVLGTSYLQGKKLDSKTWLTPSWEASSYVATEQVSNILWNPKFHYRAHKGHPLVAIPSQINPVHITVSYLAKINYIIIRLSMSWYS
jgi:hypothetical protein